MYTIADGRCIIDLAQITPSSHVWDSDLVAAGELVFKDCIDDYDPPWGGLAPDMGDEKNFQLAVKAYIPPSITCYDTPPAQGPVHARCPNTLDLMDAWEAKTTFGAAGVADVDQVLPYTFNNPTGQCAFILDTTGPNDTAAWYDLWQAAVALDGMCARGGQAGTARFLGDDRTMYMNITNISRR